MNSQKRMTRICQNIFRVDRWTGSTEKRDSWFVTEPDAPFTPSDEFGCVENGQGLFSFRLHGKTVLSEADTEFTQGFAIGETDAVYGLGMHQPVSLNRRNSVCQMVQRNAVSIAVPFMTSNAGYALLFDTCAYMSIGVDKPCTDQVVLEFDTAETCPNKIQIFADDAEVFTYYVILGDTVDQQIQGYRLLTGKAPMPARWAFGYIQSREHYHTQEQLLETAREFRKRRIPLDCIVQDWHYWGDLGWNAVEWDKQFYPDPKAMVDQIHDMDMRILLSVWSAYGPETNICKKLEDNHMILHLNSGEAAPWGQVHDAYNPKASDLVWKQMKEELFDKGIDAWWLDSTEPAMGHDNSLDLLDAEDNCLGSNRRYLNSYALTAARNVYRRQRQTTSDKRVYILTRSGYAGLQAAGASSWTGDIYATWEVFKRQIPSLLSFSASGIPYSTTDIGAFFVQFPDCDWDGIRNDEYKEMYTRWFWFGAFSPLFRSHGTSTPREMWHFGEPGTPYFDAQMAASRLRYALMPYLYANAFRIYQNDGTLMRPLVMDFPDDPRACAIEDSYMFGESLLVHAVTDYQLRKAQVYLPAGADWVDFFTGERHPGGQTVEVDAPLDRIPLFAKAGSMILMTEPAECTFRQNEDVLKVHVYPGADCETFYYRDDGDNYSYESGKFARIDFAWKDQEKTLRIAAPQGRPEHYDLNKTLEVYLDNRLVRTCAYTGEAMEIPL